MGTLANSEDPDEMQHYAAFHQGLPYLLILEQPSGTEKHHNLENSICNPLKCTMGSAILIVSICMGKSIRIQRVKSLACLFSGLSKCETRIVRAQKTPGFLLKNAHL